MNKTIKNCAIYTRKSTEEGLDQEFNTLDAQRESCEAYVLSQKADGWKTLKTNYDDGGYSGGNIERPGLQGLIEDIKAKKVQIVVVYKIDRLTRSLADFSKLVEIFDEYSVTFVSVTQSFNTTTSMGRLTLNVLLSFAQFEREVTGERIRDKIAASKKKGMWMGGFPPIGYQRVDKKLVLEEQGQRTVQLIFEQFIKLKSVKALSEFLLSQNIQTPIRISNKGNVYGEKSFSRGHLYRILNNPVYTGKIQHKDKIYNGQHEGIIEEAVFNKAQEILKEQTKIRKSKSTPTGQLLKGLLYDIDGTVYSPTYTSKGHKHYHYYISQNLLQYRDHPKGLLARIPAHEIEDTIKTAIIDLLRNKDFLNQTFPDIDTHTTKWVLKQEVDLNHEDLRKLLNKAILSTDQIELKVDTSETYKHLKQLLGIDIQPPVVKEVSHMISYKTKRVNNGAIVLDSSDQKRDGLDIPHDQLARIVKGIVWRDEHFAGETLRDIAKRYKHGENYINKCIQESFAFLSA